MKKNLLALGIGFVFACLILEVFLRIYNPFPFRLKGDRIILPASESYIIPNTLFPQLDDTIVHHKNRLGFRGPELPQKAGTSIIFVGGSTTECAYLSDGKDWPSKLAALLQKSHPDLWINNAGMNGHSTRGHQLLVEDALAQLQPDYAVFLVGLNEMHREDLHRLENLMLKSETPPLKNWLRNNSEIFSLWANFRRVNRAKQLGLWHDSHGLPDAPSFATDSTLLAQVLQTEKPLVASYQNRLEQLIAACKQHTIRPVFITQPILAGTGIDPLTGADLETVLVDKYNGLITWNILEQYNQVTREVARKKGLFLVDLADMMPHSTEYYYDFTHYTNEGAELIADLLENDFIQLLAETN